MAQGMPLIRRLGGCVDCPLPSLHACACSPFRSPLPKLGLLRRSLRRSLLSRSQHAPCFAFSVIKPVSGSLKRMRLSLNAYVNASQAKDAAAKPSARKPRAHAKAWQCVSHHLVPVCRLGSALFLVTSFVPVCIASFRGLPISGFMPGDATESAQARPGGMCSSHFSPCKGRQHLRLLTQSQLHASRAPGPPRLNCAFLVLDMLPA